MSIACRSPWPRVLVSPVDGRFYEETGAIRDVVQNHLLQVPAILASEPPSGNDPEAIRAEKTQILKAMRPLDPSEVMRGQFRGYRQNKESHPTRQSRRSLHCVWRSIPGVGQAFHFSFGLANGCR